MSTGNYNVCYNQCFGDEKLAVVLTILNFDVRLLDECHLPIRFATPTKDLLKNGF